MSDPQALDEVLRLVAEGHLSAEEAEPIIAALEAADQATTAANASASDWTNPGADDSAGPSNAGNAGISGGRYVRLEVTEGGRRVVNLRLPASLGALGMLQLPGVPAAAASHLKSALTSGARGPVFEVEGPDGDSVRMVIE